MGLRSGRRSPDFSDPGCTNPGQTVPLGCIARVFGGGVEWGGQWKGHSIPEHSYFYLKALTCIKQSVNDY